MRYSMMELEEMPTETLSKIAQEKGSRGNASPLAQKAQSILWSRSFRSYNSVSPNYIYDEDDIYDESNGVLLWW